MFSRLKVLLQESVANVRVNSLFLNRVNICLKELASACVSKLRSETTQTYPFSPANSVTFTRGEGSKRRSMVSDPGCNHKTRTNVRTVLQHHV